LRPPAWASRIRVAPTRFSTAVDEPPHRVRQVTVEAREEAEAVLGRQVGAALRAGAGHRQAAGLAAGDVTCLEHDDLEPALGQLVRRREARHAAPEDRDSVVHRGDAVTPAAVAARIGQERE
jgi:hypothetical protein